MGAIERISFYFGQYGAQVMLSLPYFAVISLVGLFLVLRRSSFFGLVLSGVAQFSFLVGMSLHFLSHGNAHGHLNQGDVRSLVADLLHMDLYLFPLTLFLMAPFIYYISRSAFNAESVLAALLVFFMGLLPLTNRLLGGSDLILLKAYFTEILYTPREVFGHYLYHLAAVALLYAVFFRKFLLCGFDPPQARLQNIRVEMVNAFFYFLSGFTIALCIRVLGVYVTMMALLVPGILSLALFQRLRVVATAAIMISLVFSLCGYLISFSFDGMPTEPTIIVFFGAAGLLMWAVRKVFVLVRVKGG